MTATTPKKRRKKPKAKHKPRSGRPAATDAVRVYATKRKADGPPTAEFIFSEDVIMRLLQMHDDVYRPFYTTRYQDRWATVRIEFARLTDLGMPMVFVRIEPPSYDPHGYRLTRTTKTSRTFKVRVPPNKLGLRPEIRPRTFELMWFDTQRAFMGLGLIFDDADVVPLTEAQLRKVPIDLAVHARTRPNLLNP